MRKYFELAVIIFVGNIFLIGCSQKEINDLRYENKEHKLRISELELENSRLKETAEYHYQRGVDFLTSYKYEEAYEEFRVVVEKYPTSSLVVPAKRFLIRIRTPHEYAKDINEVEKSFISTNEQKIRQYEILLLSINADVISHPEIKPLRDEVIKRIKQYKDEENNEKKKE